MNKKLFSSLTAFILIFAITTSASASPVVTPYHCGTGAGMPCLDRG